MSTHSYVDLRYGILHSIDWRCKNGHLIHCGFETIYFDDIVWR